MSRRRSYGRRQHELGERARRARLVDSRDGLAVWERDGIVVMTAAAQPEDSPRLAAAIERRRDSMLDGRCACGAVIDTAGTAPRLAAGRIDHAADCDAGDERFTALLAQRTAP